MGILNGVCRKLSAGEKQSLVDAIEDVLIDRSDAMIQIWTLEVDVMNLKSNNANFEYENGKLTT